MAQNGIPANEDVNITKVNRVFGGIQFPSDPMAVQPMPGKDLPVNFFVRFSFADAETANDMLDSIKDKGSKTIKVGDKTYYSPDDGQTPPNLRLHMVNEKTVEMGTERYIMLPDRKVTKTSLNKYWSQVPKSAAIRLSIDLESNREVIDQLMEMAKASAPSDAAPFLDLINDLAGITLGVDFDSDTMLMLRASGKNEEGTEKLFSGINGLLGMGRFFGQQSLTNAPLDEAAKGVFKEMLNSLKANTEGDVISVDIKKPEKFDDVIGQMMGK
ncbi:MAG: hypothetical protein AAGA30_19855, partial [Planctomycetota bacterium]